MFYLMRIRVFTTGRKTNTGTTTMARRSMAKLYTRCRDAARENYQEDGNAREDNFHEHHYSLLLMDFRMVLLLITSSVLASYWAKTLKLQKTSAIGLWVYGLQIFLVCTGHRLHIIDNRLMIFLHPSSFLTIEKLYIASASICKR